MNGALARPSPPHALAGIHSVLSTPFLSDDAIDLASLDRLVDRHVLSGVASVVLFGLAGEGMRLTAAERLEIVRRVTDRLAGRLPVIAAADHQSSRAAAELARLIQDAGVTAIMALPPVGAYDEMSLVDYYRRIDDATSVPVIVQDAPAATGTTLSPDLLARICRDSDHVRWVKVEAPPTARKIADIVGTTNGAMGILGGMGGRNLIAELRAGATGTMIGCALPQVFVEIYEAWASGDVERAERLWEALLPILTFDDSVDTFIACQKVLLERDGTFETARLRSPAPRLEEPARQEWLRRIERLAALRPDLLGLGHSRNRRRDD